MIVLQSPVQLTLSERILHADYWLLLKINREWHAPSPEKSPEVLCVRDAMDKAGCHLAMDVHWGGESKKARFTSKLVLVSGALCAFLTLLKVF